MTERLMYWFVSLTNKYRHSKWNLFVSLINKYRHTKWHVLQNLSSCYRFSFHHIKRISNKISCKAWPYYLSVCIPCLRLLHLFTDSRRKTSAIKPGPPFLFLHVTRDGNKGCCKKRALHYLFTYLNVKQKIAPLQPSSTLRIHYNMRIKSAVKAWFTIIIFSDPSIKGAKTESPKQHVSDWLIHIKVNCDQRHKKTTLYCILWKATNDWSMKILWNVGKRCVSGRRKLGKREKKVNTR